LHGRQLPAPAGEFAGDRDVGDQSVLAAFGETAPPLVEAPVTGVAASPKRQVDLGPADPKGGPRGAVGLAVMPRRFDQQPSHMGVAGLGDRTLHAGVARGLLRRHQADVGADRGSGEPRPVTDLHRQRQPGQ